jgi:hypothetical protein
VTSSHCLIPEGFNFPVYGWRGRSAVAALPGTLRKPDALDPKHSLDSYGDGNADTSVTLRFLPPVGSRRLLSTQCESLNFKVLILLRVCSLCGERAFIIVDDLTRYNGQTMTV